MMLTLALVTTMALAWNVAAQTPAATGGQTAAPAGQTQPAGTGEQKPASSPAPNASSPEASYVPERVYDTSRRAFSDFEVMLADLAGADVVFVGEQHDDPNTHRLELAVLEGLHRRKVPLAVSLEMFERDVQAVLDRYLAGSIDEAEFLKGARPWPRYATDYRALVEFARARGFPVLAANIPRRIASEVARRGEDAIRQLPETQRPFAAADWQCPKDGYYARFVKAMGSHPAGGEQPSPEKQAEAEATSMRYYVSQCMKDETMAESIARFVSERGGKAGTVVHFNGAFHSDFGLGAAERTARRLPGRRIATVTMVPVQDIDKASPSTEDQGKAHYIVYTVKP